MHGVTPFIGRNFSRDETDPGAPLVALLGYGYWQSRYSGREDVIGQSVRFDTEVATIIGVLPSWFNATTPVAIPLRIPLAEYSRRGTGRVSVYARLRPDVTIEQARERLSSRMQVRTLPDGRKPVSHASRSGRGSTERWRNTRTTINVLTGAVTMILLIACVNVAGLLLARGAARQSELAVRASIGAGRGRLIRQLLTENGVRARDRRRRARRPPRLALPGCARRQHPAVDAIELARRRSISRCWARRWPCSCRRRCCSGWCRPFGSHACGWDRRWRAAAVSEGLRSRGAAASCSSHGSGAGRHSGQRRGADDPQLSAYLRRRTRLHPRGPCRDGSVAARPESRGSSGVLHIARAADSHHSRDAIGGHRGQVLTERRHDVHVHLGGRQASARSRSSR